MPKAGKKAGRVMQVADKRFRARIVIDGKRESRYFIHEQDAHRWLEQQRDAKKSGEYAAERLSRAITLREALERYSREISSKKRQAQGEQNTINRVLKALGPVADMPLASVLTSHIATYVRRRLETPSQRAGDVGNKRRSQTLSPSTVNRELAVISHCYTVCTAHWGIDNLRNPVRAGVRVKEPSGRTRRLEGDEEQRLIAAAMKHDATPWTKVFMVPVIHFAIESAMRLSEIASLEWRNVNLIEGSALLPMTKNGRARKVPLTPYLIRMLSSLPRRPDGLVFYPKSAINTAWKKVRDASGIHDLRFHDLRHEAISRLFEETSLSETEVAAISGHLSPVMLRRYTHLRVGPIVAKLAEAEAKRDELRARRGSRPG
jgi:integrase